MTHIDEKVVIVYVDEANLLIRGGWDGKNLEITLKDIIVENRFN